MDKPVTQIDVMRGMTMEQRWRVAQNLYFTAREWKAAALRAFHPDWDENKLKEALRESFLHDKELHTMISKRSLLDACSQVMNL